MTTDDDQLIDNTDDYLSIITDDNVLVTDEDYRWYLRKILIVLQRLISGCEFYANRVK
jgi:hypothetical protein